MASKSVSFIVREVANYDDQNSIAYGSKTPEKSCTKKYPGGYQKKVSYGKDTASSLSNRDQPNAYFCEGFGKATFVYCFQDPLNSDPSNLAKKKKC